MARKQMVYRSLDKMQDQDKVLAHAEHLLTHLDQL
ncbi:hypothetical protein QE380_002817 [Acinetobacter baylyi]|uniref:Uncharacterized protein n=1 Tax=Acinetobacter baylyi TaxID=202950 RepID=A0ABU0UZC6_ACIBI|nr:hypothetical protein [Acinetobacter baylyi]MDR6106509.1 hypothetical protein [Acinetobacter baylyi]MDR6186764.1 hypothetical protein [Acinetobacter baylyi]